MRSGTDRSRKNEECTWDQSNTGQSSTCLHNNLIYLSFQPTKHTYPSPCFHPPCPPDCIAIVHLAISSLCSILWSSRRVGDLSVHHRKVVGLEQEELVLVLVPNYIRDCLVERLSGGVWCIAVFSKICSSLTDIVYLLECDHLWLLWWFAKLIGLALGARRRRTKKIRSWSDWYASICTSLALGTRDFTCTTRTPCLWGQSAMSFQHQG